MPKEPEDRRPTERTAKGYEVPVPKRGEFFSNLKKVAKPEEGKDSGSARRPRKK
jgi:hypothetical protein